MLKHEGTSDARSNPSPPNPKSAREKTSCTVLGREDYSIIGNADLSWLLLLNYLVARSGTKVRIESPPHDKSGEEPKIGHAH